VTEFAFPADVLFSSSGPAHLSSRKVSLVRGSFPLKTLSTSTRPSFSFDPEEPGPEISPPRQVLRTVAEQTTSASPSGLLTGELAIPDWPWAAAHVIVDKKRRNATLSEFVAASSTPSFYSHCTTKCRCDEMCNVMWDSDSTNRETGGQTGRFPILTCTPLSSSHLEPQSPQSLKLFSCSVHNAVGQHSTPVGAAEEIVRIQRTAYPFKRTEHLRNHAPQNRR
jgi:hypothetical protein